MKVISTYLMLGTAVVLSACGTYVLEIQDFGDSTAGLIYVHNIVLNIDCEVRNAVYDLYKQEAGSKDIAFLDNWGAQMDLTLAVNEMGQVVPDSTFLPLGQPKNWIFNWGIGATLSSSATRTDKLSFFYLVSDLKNSHVPRDKMGFFCRAT